MINGAIERLSHLQEQTRYGAERCENGALSSRPLSWEPGPSLTESRPPSVYSEGLRSVPSSPLRAAPAGAIVRARVPE